jgi:hypothetical protein
MSNDDNVSIKLLEQHWTHARHADTVRSAMTAFFGAIVAGVAAYLREAKNQMASPWLLAVLCLLSFFGLLFSLKTGFVFALHTERAEIRLPESVKFLPQEDESGMFSS